MRTKPTHLLACILLLLAPAISYAQVTDAKTVTLNVVLSDAVSITVLSGTGGEIATLNYTSLSDYQNGVTLDQPNAIKIKSNKPYTVKVKALGDLTNSGSPTETIPVVNVKVSASATGTTGITFPSAVGLTTADQTIITSTNGTLDQNFDLKYTTVGGTQADFLNKPAGTYTTTLTYTVSAP